LRELMSDKSLQDFNLVGGTALSLYLGHRQSIDLDLFCQKEFDVSRLRKRLVDTYGFKERFSERQTLKGEINGIFIDCIRYDFPRVSPVNLVDGIRLMSIPDLLAMKLDAITDSREREKDFVDIACFSTKVSLNQMLGFYSKKYPGVNLITPVKALLYYNDIKRNEPLILTAGEYKWFLIEDRIKQMVNSPDMIFEALPVEMITEVEREHKKTKGFHR